MALHNVLFVWSEMKSLQRYGKGKVIAYGNSVQEARTLAIQIFTTEQIEMFGIPEHYEDAVEAFTKEVNSTEPQVFETLAALILWGSE